MLWGDKGMAPTEGRVAKHDRRWGCRRGTSAENAKLKMHDEGLEDGFIYAMSRNN